MKKSRYVSVKWKIGTLYGISILSFLVFSVSGLYELLSKMTGMRFAFLLFSVFLTTAVFIAVYLLLLKPIVKIKGYSGINTGMEGDLTTRLEVKYNDELGQFSKSFNVFLAKIHSIVFKLKNIIKASNEMGESLAANTSESAASIREITATILSMKEREFSLKSQVSLTHEATDDIRTSIKGITELIESQAAAL
jgi:methyl-accepting chemotaxis protein